MKVQKVVTYHSPQPKAAARIAQCLLLTLSSDRDGKVVAAVAAARRGIANAGPTIRAVADAVQAGLGRTPAPLQEPDWRSTARFYRSHPDLLSEKEVHFIATIMQRDQPLSPKQDKWLSDIEARLRGWL